ncbi:MAG: NAD(P)/FAD-dependent oxidoreductase [Nanoarchaeota archaeon]|nr:NAD(P)/FAD-dependent oxidoreductase [Nanoarchaeota archaeon]
MEADYVIIGAGPAGSYLAKKLAMRGASVSVFEKEKKVGIPVQCTGLFTEKIKQFVNTNKNFVVNTTNKIELHSVKSKALIKSNEIVVNRTRFDNYLKEEAEKSGVDYYLNHCLTGYKMKNNRVELFFDNGLKVDSKNIIGCDGPLSTVNKLFKLNEDNKCFFAKQFVVKSEEFNNDTFHAYFGEEYNDFFSWIVPCGKNCLRIGTGNSNHLIVNKLLDYFIKKLRIKAKILDVNAGLIPLHDPDRVLFKRFNSSNVYLMGDAAGIVKATSGGGVVPSFQMINESYKYVLEGESLRFPKTRFELLAHLALHKILSSLNDNDLNQVINEFSDEIVSNILKTLNRDNIIELVYTLIKKKPELLKYSKYLIRLL